MARQKRRKNQPPVSLNPLEPEEALAGLLQVKPEEKDTPTDEQEEPQPEDKNDDDK